MACVRLDSRCRLGSEQLDLVLIDRGRSYVLIVERSCHVEDCLVQAAHGLELPAGGRLPRLDKAIAPTCVKNGTITIEGQTCGLCRVGTIPPSHVRRHSRFHVRRSQVLWFDDLTQL